MDVGGTIMEGGEADSLNARMRISAEREGGRWDNLELTMDVTWLVLDPAKVSSRATRGRGAGG